MGIASFIFFIKTIVMHSNKAIEENRVATFACMGFPDGEITLT